MVTVNFVTWDGKVIPVEASSGQSVMEAALEHDVQGILADCGGSLSCATCHVYLPPEWLERIGRAGEAEAEMLEMAVDPRENSRLSCQIILDESTDGLSVNLPKAQF